jgi:alpha-galactosidase
MRDTKSSIGADSTVAIPIELISNMEEQLEEEEKDWGYDSSDEDYTYDDDSDGNSVRRKSSYPRYNNNTEVPHFVLSMVFRSKNQLVKALKMYGLVTKRRISFTKCEADRVRAKCGWPNCPWLLYATKTLRSSRFQIITFNDVHQCAQNRDNRLVTARVIAKRYEHFIVANPMWKIESMKATVLQDMFADVSTSKCKHAKKLVMEKLLSGMKN